MLARYVRSQRPAAELPPGIDNNRERRQRLQRASSMFDASQAHRRNLQGETATTVLSSPALASGFLFVTLT